MPKTILVQLWVNIPDDATDRDITDYVDVELAGVNSMSTDNPLVDNFDVVDREWENWE